MREQRNIAKTPLTYNYFLRFSIKIFPDFWPQATPYLAAGQQPHPLAAGQAPLIGRRPQRIAEFFCLRQNRIVTQKSQKTQKFPQG